ncbi:MAG: chromate efflux transporter [Ignavibacteria bacterium]|nr:chromate efflux transporter [Ignavibacteria bacterium]
MTSKPSYKEAFMFWLKLGFISFGGPAGQIAIMHEYLVDKKKWISDSKFLSALNFCMLLPGPEAQQLAAYNGWLLHGVRGGLTAGILFILPSVFILLGLSIVYVSFGNIPWIIALFSGLKPAVVAIVVIALIRIAKKSLITPLHYITAAAAFVCIYFLNIPFPLIILGALIVAFTAGKFYPAMTAINNENNTGNSQNEKDYYINSFSEISVLKFNPLQFIKMTLIFAFLWLIPFNVFYFYPNDFEFWKTLSLFFTKAAFVTFGGAYAVLPYVAQFSVENLQWLTELQMIDGLALGETTPGPLVMVLAFVGFMAGFNFYGGSLLMGTAGLLTTVFYTFLPSFYFIFAGAPLIERSHKNNFIKNSLSIVTAAVVGIILNLSIYFGKAVIFPGQLSLNNIDFFAVIWIIISMIVLYKYNFNVAVWILISAVAGLIHFLVF